MKDYDQFILEHLLLLNGVICS